VVSVRDAAKVWDLFEAGFNHMAIGGDDDNPRAELIGDFKEETGLDIQSDLVSNLFAAAVVVTDLSKGLDIEHGGALYFEGKDAARTLAAVRVLVSQTEKHEELNAEERAGAKVWRTDEALIAVKGTLVLVAQWQDETRAAAERLLKQFIEGGEGLRKTLATRQPGATTFATIDGARFFPQAGLDRLTAGLTVDATGVTFRVEGGGRNLLAGIARLLSGAGLAAAVQDAPRPGHE
jgi:hypothetical protein